MPVDMKEMMAEAVRKLLMDKKYISRRPKAC